jgi:hypothetical protein
LQPPTVGRSGWKVQSSRRGAMQPRPRVAERTSQTVSILISSIDTV